MGSWNVMGFQADKRIVNVNALAKARNWAYKTYKKSKHHTCRFMCSGLGLCVGEHVYDWTFCRLIVACFTLFMFSCGSPVVVYSLRGLHLLPCFVQVLRRSLNVHRLDHVLILSLRINWPRSWARFGCNTENHAEILRKKVMHQIVECKNWVIKCVS